MEDTYWHKGLRKKLVKEIESKGINDKAVLEAMMQVPRHFFMENAFEEQAYKDRAFPIASGKGQTISQPYTVAFQTTLLNIQKREKVLEIGTGSGYQAAILREMGARVFTIERQQDIYLHTKKLLERIGFNLIRTYWRDGYKGLPEFAPFDKIIVTAAAPEIPNTLLSQLKIGGRLVIPIGKSGEQKMYCIIRKDTNEYEENIIGDFSFVPFLKGVEKKN